LPPATSAPLRFGRFVLRPAERALLLDGQALPLGARAYDTLLALVERRERIVPKNELLDLVWPDVVVEEHNIAVQVSMLRKLLGSEAIATIPGRGYRFTAALHGAVEPPASPAARPHADLPDALPALIGRDDELAALSSLLDKHRLVSVTGAGGIGKTLLAQHVARRRRGAHEHDVGWVELAAIADPTQVTGAIAAAVDVHLGSGDALPQLAAALAPLDVLLVLDNCEHLLDEVARIVSTLLARAPHLRVLATSQAPLKLLHEHVYRLGALAVPGDATIAPTDTLGYGAVALFVERARSAGRDFALTGTNCAAVVEIVRRLDGLPLAIELAAARVPLLGVQRLSQALGERLRVLTAGARDAPARQRTLLAALQWSHGLLDGAGQAVFRRLAVMAGSASLELVQQVAADASLDAWGVVDALGALVDRSLVAVSKGEPARYRLLETPRAFALERLREAGEEDALRARHARMLAAQLARIYDECYRAGRLGIGEMRAQLELELDNARAAFAWALEYDEQTTLAIAPPLLAALMRAPPSERMAVCDAIEPLLFDGALPLSLRAAAALAGSVVVNNHHYLRGMDWARRTLALCRQVGDRRDLCDAWSALGFACSRDVRGRDETVEALRNMRELFDPAWPPQLTNRILSIEGVMLGHLGEHDEGFAVLRRAVRLQHEAGLPEASALNNLVFGQVQAERFADAVRDGRELLARMETSRNGNFLDLARRNVTIALLGHGDLAEARQLAIENWPLTMQYQRQAYWVPHLAWLAALQRRPHAAARLIGAADAAMAALHDERNRFDWLSYRPALRFVCAELGEAEVERLRAEGAALGDREIAMLAFGVDAVN
jgi:predicted ATPase/DNA-binding winged helix-turn-helix (wHTH) protein